MYHSLCRKKYLSTSNKRQYLGLFQDQFLHKIWCVRVHVLMSFSTEHAQKVLMEYIATDA